MKTRTPAIADCEEGIAGFGQTTLRPVSLCWFAVSNARNLHLAAESVNRSRRIVLISPLVFLLAVAVTL